MVALQYLTLGLSAVAAGVMAAPQTIVERQADKPDYDQKYITGANVDFQGRPDGFSVSYTDTTNFVVGKGWKTGTDRSITFQGTHDHTAGVSLVGAYGWLRNPLAEFYVREWASWGLGSAQDPKVGEFETDGSIYDVYVHHMVDAPAIEGPGKYTFDQYISMRRDPRPNGGTITLKNHFDAYKRFGLAFGTLDVQVFAVEGWGGASGKTNYTVSGA